MFYHSGVFMKSDFPAGPSSMEPMTLEFRPGVIEPLLELAQAFFNRSLSVYNRINNAEKESLVRLRLADQCFQSNMIEGVHLSFQDVAAALKNQGGVKTLAKAHINASRWADAANLRSMGISRFLLGCHEVFISGLPDELRSLEGTRIQVDPGQWREINVQVGHHTPPRAQDVRRCMDRFEEVYSPFLTRQMTGKDQLMAIVHGFISHHRLVWIHPFADFNGRISRIFLDKWLADCQVPGIDIWTVSAGFARDGGVQYMSMLHNADQPRQGALDGRGNLTEKGMADFVRFCLEAAY